MKCSVVILNWNGEQMLRQFLPSVVEFSASPETEVVVADNGSGGTETVSDREDYRLGQELRFR